MILQPGDRVKVLRSRGIYAPEGVGTVLRLQQPARPLTGSVVVRLDGEHTFQTPVYMPWDLERLDEDAGQAT